MVTGPIVWSFSWRNACSFEWGCVRQQPLELHLHHFPFLSSNRLSLTRIVSAYIAESSSLPPSIPFHLFTLVPLLLCNPIFPYVFHSFQIPIAKEKPALLILRIPEITLPRLLVLTETRSFHIVQTSSRPSSKVKHLSQVARSWRCQ